MRQIVLPRPQPSAGTDPAYVRGVVLVALAGGFWSLGGLLVRLVEAASSWQIILFRSLALALSLLLIIGLRNRGRLVRPFRNVGFNGAAAGMALSGGFIGFVLALEHTSVANATFMLGTSPFFAALLGRLILGERVRRLTLLAMVLTAIGILVMVSGGLVLGTVAGNLLALGASCCFSIFSVLLRRGRHDMLPCAAIAGMFAALVALPIAISEASGIGAALMLSPRDLALCAVMGSIQVGLGLTVFTLGARHVPAAELALLSMTELVLAPIWVWLGVGEVPSGFTLIGGAIILLAIASGAFSDARRRVPPALV
jgi:DME family drug/metabolite transporter